jgi:hypothetical protein
MAVTGLVLMFPAVVTRVLPGVVVYAAKAAHGLEALLAVASIITWHMYNTHLAQGLFPLDRTIFTGEISRERLVHEHPLEYERLLASAAPAGAAVPAQPRRRGLALPRLALPARGRKAALPAPAAEPLAAAKQEPVAAGAVDFTVTGSVACTKPMYIRITPNNSLRYRKSGNPSRMNEPPIAGMRAPIAIRMLPTMRLNRILLRQKI